VAPFYAVADLGVRLARIAGAQVAADGFSRPYLAAVAYGSACYGFLAILLSVFVARRVVGEGPLAAAIVWIGTPLSFTCISPLVWRTRALRLPSRCL